MYWSKFKVMGIAWLCSVSVSQVHTNATRTRRYLRSAQTDRVLINGLINDKHPWWRVRNVTRFDDCCSERWNAIRCVQIVQVQSEKGGRTSIEGYLFTKEDVSGPRSPGVQELFYLNIIPQCHNDNPIHNDDGTL